MDEPVFKSRLETGPVRFKLGEWKRSEPVQFLGVMSWRGEEYDVYIDHPTPSQCSAGWRPFMYFVAYDNKHSGYATWAYKNRLPETDSFYKPIMWITDYITSNWWYIVSRDPIGP